jgi:DNA-binding CsgD family transcriptional regulator
VPEQVTVDDISSLADDTALTTRELAVLRLTAEGLTNAEISARLFITVRTVKHHSASVRKKLGARTLAHAVTLGYKLRLLSVNCPRGQCDVAT